ncbi:hypothetical protein L218DRAFT_1047398 [Marasmius fiardii PR-910]|nr:hypothetical protein L218DRAFT_1047398 [Marasmius fiardii PR-910]
MPVFNSVAKEVDKVRTRGRSKNWEDMMRTGAHVTPETVSVWEDLVKTNPLVKPYRNADDSMIGGTQDREFDGESQPWDIEDPTKELPADDESPEEVESITQWKIEDLDWLTGEEQLDMLDLFENSSTAVDMFLGFKSLELQRR